MSPIYNILIYFVWALSTYFVILLLLVMYTRRDQLYERKSPLNTTPKVSVIIPAYNEAKKIHLTIASLRKVTYPNIEFIFINDGSTDTTSTIITEQIAGDSRFKFIDREHNKGKAASLNEAITHATGTFIACMDADSVIEPNIFEKALPYFDTPKVGAVTVTVEVLNPKTWLDKIIDLEYIIGLSLFLKVFSFFNCIFVTPGPFSIYRKQLFDVVGGFDPNNITEDHEIAFRIHKHGYHIRNCLDAKVYTILPEKFSGLYKQRRRWYAGAIQSLIQHRDVIFNKKLGLFGIFMPYNYLLIALGLFIFYISTFLGISRAIHTLLNYRHTGFDILNNMLHFHVDLLTLNNISFIAIYALLLTFTLMLLGLKFSRKNYANKKIGMISFPLLFFFYQIFWLGAIIAVIKRGKISWR